eukprot:11190066-Lingulodinium_polyedra.AAC.1
MVQHADAQGAQVLPARRGIRAGDQVRGHVVVGAEVEPEQLEALLHLQVGQYPQQILGELVPRSAVMQPLAHHHVVARVEDQAACPRRAAQRGQHHHRQ